MNVFCRLFGHTWVPGTDAPSLRWNTTKEGHILAASVESEGVHHFQQCRRCGERKEDAPRKLDGDGLDGDGLDGDGLSGADAKQSASAASE